MSQPAAKGEAPSTGVMNKLRSPLSSSPQHPAAAPLLSQHRTEQERAVPGGCSGQPLISPRLGPEQLGGDAAPRQRLQHSRCYPAITDLTRHTDLTCQKPPLTDIRRNRFQRPPCSIVPPFEKPEHLMPINHPNNQ